jgi:hypothetical protein
MLAWALSYHVTQLPTRKSDNGIAGRLPYRHALIEIFFVIRVAHSLVSWLGSIIPRSTCRGFYHCS